MVTLKSLFLAVFCTIAADLQAQKYVGGDISLLPEYENAGAKYIDRSGKTRAPLYIFHEEGMNAMRVRLFVNPKDYPGSDKDANACQDIGYVKALGKCIKDAGFKLMLDFHYSDTWADPAKQWTPEAWAELTDEELYQKIYDYTKDALQAMKDAGAEPDFIQTGNEISYGMLWGRYGSAESALKKCYVNSPSANWTRFITLLKKAGEACREACPQAKIIIHTERAAQISVLTNFYDKMKSAGLDYDIIGLSYYPYFHGALGVLDNALTALETRYPDKKIMVVEFGYPYAWEVPGTTYNYSATYPYNDDGQRKLTADVITLLNKHSNVNGLFWWWMEYNAFGTSLAGWYNAPLFYSSSGWATPAISELKTFLNGTDGITAPSVSADDASVEWFNLSGQRIGKPVRPGVYINGGRKVLVK